MRVPSNPRIVEDTTPELCTQLSCRALKTQPGQNHVLQNLVTKPVILAGCKDEPLDCCPQNRK